MGRKQIHDIKKVLDEEEIVEAEEKDKPWGADDDGDGTELVESSEGGDEEVEEQSEDSDSAEEKKTEDNKPAPVGEVQKEAYKPDFTYVVEDDRLEIEEFLRPIVKDQETEKKLKELLTAAKGLDKVKGARDTYRKRYEDTDKQYKEIRSRFQPAEDLYKKGHKVESFLSLYKPEDILEVAEKISKLKDVPPEERDNYERAIRNNIDGYYGEKEKEDLYRRNQDIEFKLVDHQIDMALNYDQEVKPIAEWVDSLHGKGFFKKRVYNYGALNYNENSPITPGECVKAIVKEYSPFFLSGQRGNSNPAAVGNSSNTVVQKDRIPTAKSKGSVAGRIPIAKRPAKEQTFEAARKALEEEYEDEE